MELYDNRIQLKLFIAGSSVRSGNAIANLKRICDESFPGCYQLDIIDVLQQPGMAEVERVLATPTLIKIAPPPARRIIGDLADKEKVLAGIGFSIE